VALAEMLMAAPPEDARGIDVDLGVLEADALPSMFSEAPGIVFEVSPERAARLFQAARERGLPAWPIGSVSARRELRMLLPGGATAGWTAKALREAAAQPLAKLWNEEVS
jgi:hypothetical protein